MSRILFMGAPYEVVSRSSRTLEDQFSATGHNTGNLLIGNGLKKILAGDRVEPYRAAMTPEFIEENFDQVVIAAANFLYPGFDFSPWSDVLDKVRLPVFMVGLGVQLPSKQSQLKDIHPGTWRLVEIASERSHAIGVRGEFTAQRLREHGIRNVQVTGCPSLYTNLAPETRLRRPKAVERVAVNGSRNVVSHSVDPESARRVEGELLRLAMTRKLPYVLQNEQPEMQLAFGTEVADESLTGLAASAGCAVAELREFWRSQGRLFFAVDEWFEWIREYDFSLGTRFHGNVAALLNGVPALVLTHDSRTQELCEFAAIPHLPVSDVARLDVEELAATADLDAFEARYADLHQDYVEFLDANGIPHALVTAESSSKATTATPRRVEVAGAQDVAAGIRFAAHCPICDEAREFHAPDDYFSCRSQLKSSDCKLGGCVTRERALAKVVLDVLGRDRLRTARIHEAAPTGRGLTLWMRQHCQEYVGSGYFPDQVWGALVKGLRNEDLENQTFPDESFDLVLHLDVMEHVFNPFQALREIYRTLRPGGHCIFTAPTYAERVRSEQVAFLEADGSVRVIGPPEYHGNPQDPERGALVTWRYGYDFPLLIARESDFSVEVRRWQSKQDAVLGPMTEVYLLTKPIT